MNVCLTRWAIGTVIACAIFALVTGAVTKAQRLSGSDLAIVEVDGTRTVLGRLPLSVFAPRLSPDGKRIAYRDTWLDPNGDPAAVEVDGVFEVS